MIMNNADKLSLAMQVEAIRIAEQRMGKPLPAKILANLDKSWSYAGLEMIIDTVRTVEIEDLERYLTALGK